MSRTQRAEFLIWNAAIQRSIDAYWSQPITSGPVCEVCGFTSGPAVCRDCAACAETLRKAAALIRKERGAHEFFRAVADWIEEVEAWDAEGLGTGAGGTNFPDMWDDMKFMAHTVARVYLGESA